MDMNGSQILPSAQHNVWQHLVTPGILQQCIPGCTDLHGDLENGFTAIIIQKIGPVKATFKGSLSVSNIVHGHSYTLTGKAAGAAAGFVSGKANIHLRAIDSDTTEMTYSVNAKLGGKLAQLGARLIDGFAHKTAQEFFSRFSALFQQGNSTAL